MSRYERSLEFYKYASKGFTRFDWEFGWFLLIVLALGYDAGFMRLVNITFGLLSAIIMWDVCTFILGLILHFVKKRMLKKSNIEKLIDEEIRKD